MKTIVFEEITLSDKEFGYTGGCSGSRSDCCTRTCTRKMDTASPDGFASEADWGKFLEVAGGVVQY